MGGKPIGWCGIVSKEESWSVGGEGVCDPSAVYEGGVLTYVLACKPAAPTYCQTTRKHHDNHVRKGAELQRASV